MSRTVEITKDGNNYIVNPNASSGGGATAYCWHLSDGGQEERGVMYFNFDKAPADLTELNQKKVLVPRARERTPVARARHQSARRKRRGDRTFAAQRA